MLQSFKLHMFQLIIAKIIKHHNNTHPIDHQTSPEELEIQGTEYPKFPVILSYLQQVGCYGLKDGGGV